MGLKPSPTGLCTWTTATPAAYNLKMTKSFTFRFWAKECTRRYFRFILKNNSFIFLLDVCLIVGRRGGTMTFLFHSIRIKSGAIFKHQQESFIIILGKGAWLGIKLNNLWIFFFFKEKSSTTIWQEILVTPFKRRLVEVSRNIHDHPDRLSGPPNRQLKEQQLCKSMLLVRELGLDVLL